MSAWFGIICLITAQAGELPAPNLLQQPFYQDPPIGEVQQAYPGVKFTLRQFKAITDGQQELRQYLVEFAPGAHTPAHRSRENELAYVVQGEILVQQQGKRTVYKTGQHFIPPQDSERMLGNASNKQPAQMLLTVLTPSQGYHTRQERR